MGESAIRPTPDIFEPIGEFGWESVIRSSRPNDAKRQLQKLPLPPGKPGDPTHSLQHARAIRFGLT
jgi:hypothetical protein